MNGEVININFTTTLISSYALVSINGSEVVKMINFIALGFKLIIQGYFEVAVMSIFVHKTAAVIRYSASEKILNLIGILSDKLRTNTLINL